MSGCKVTFNRHAASLVGPNISAVSRLRELDRTARRGPRSKRKRSYEALNEAEERRVEMIVGRVPTSLRQQRYHPTKGWRMA